MTTIAIKRHRRRVMPADEPSLQRLVSGLLGAVCAVAAACTVALLLIA